jgi:hypothetical protein
MNSQSLRLLSGQPKTLHARGSIHPKLASAAKIREARVTGGDQLGRGPIAGPGYSERGMDPLLTHLIRPAAS